MNIECPHCDTGNTIDFAENIHCHKCKKNFTGFSFRKVKGSIFSTSVLLVGAALVGQKVDREFFEAARYPSAAIYEIISYCSNPQGMNLTRHMQQKMASTCACALDKTMPDVNGRDLKRQSSEFVKVFNKNLKSCR